MKEPLSHTEDDLFEHYNIVADKGQNPLRIDRFLVDKLPNVSRNKIQLAAKHQLILVNQKVVKQNYKIKAGDTVSFYLPHPKREYELTPQDIPLIIVYEDEHLMVINKPAGMVVHPGHGNRDGTLVNALAYHFSDIFKDKKNLRPGLVHRIDKNTTGLLVVAKEESVQAHLSAQFFHKTTKRSYKALVWGAPEPSQGTVEGYLGRHLKDRLQMQLFDDQTKGKYSLTHYKVIEDLYYVSLIECQLETGRTHQIRAHLRHKGHPLFNDDRYGGDKILKGTTFSKYKSFVKGCFSLLSGQALHAHTLGFIHPISKKEMLFKAELPQNFLNVLDRWRKYIQFHQP